MSQFYTTAPGQRPPAPREETPPCQRFVLFDGRAASLIDKSLCDGHHGPFGLEFRFYFIAGYFTEGGSDLTPHKDYPTGVGRLEHPVVRGGTSDPAEAEAAWERAERWVRTGVLDEG